MKKTVLVATLSCLLFSNGLARATTPPRILMVVDQGYRPEEYFQPRKLFDRAGFLVQVGALYPGTVLPSRPHLCEVPPNPS